ncbi:MAG: DNA-binding response regulator [Bacteroidetes bacterium HGW-Bacteroidetes-6]|jgi:DNA-binding LytR/AlgR family response regulator|nr:MAG: DNA-binding response regulator [Bacteroidetes bacterium HGW-Bacteroidetes-6]
MTRVLIAEDEQLASRRLVRMLLQCNPNFEVKATTTGVDDTVKWLVENEADLIFMDIHLADGSAFEIFTRVEVKPPVIFTTAYDEYALRAFRVNSIDYLLKPIDAEELSSALKKYEQLAGGKPDYLELKELIRRAATGKTIYKTRFAIETGQKMRFFNSTDIAWFRADNKIVSLRSNDGFDFPVDYTLEELDMQLDPALFFRLNRKFIARIDAVDQVFLMPKSRLKVVLKPDTEEEIYVSAERSQDMKKWLGK